MAIRIFLIGKKKSYPQAWPWGKIQSSRLKALRLRRPSRCQVSSEEKRYPDLGVESAVVGASMQAFSMMFVRIKRPTGWKSVLPLVLAVFGLAQAALAETPS